MYVRTYVHIEMNAKALFENSKYLADSIDKYDMPKYDT